MSTVMVVDDMAVVREPIAASLRGAGHKTICAADGKEALALIKRNVPDMILLDLSMPGMDGLSVLRALRGDPLTAKTPVILLTASAEKEHVIQAARWGVRDYILKSRFSLAELLARVQKYMKPEPAPPVLTSPTAAVVATKLEPAAQPRSLSREQTLERITACTQIKTLPGIVAEVMALVSSPRGDASDLATVLKRDPVLASRVLQVANSAAFASQKPRISTIEEAVRNIGVAGIRGIVMSVGIFESFPPDGKDTLSVLRCWQHSFAVASLMEKLAAGMNGVPAGLAHLTGLCHDLGDIVLRQHFVEQYVAVVDLATQTGRPRWQAEAAVFGMPYHELVTVLLAKLGLPPAITAPIGEFFARAVRKEAADNGDVLARALRIANVYAHGLMLAPTPDAPLTPITAAEYRSTFGAGEAINLDDEIIRSEVLMTVNLLAAVSSAEAAKLLQPMVNKTTARVVYFRHSSYCQFDPLAALLRLTSDVELRHGLPIPTAPVDGSNALVIAASRFENPEATRQEIDHLANFLHDKPVPTLYLTGTDPKDLRVPPCITAAKLPIPLNVACSFIASLPAVG